MNRGFRLDLHSAAESSLSDAVNGMWKLCKSGGGREARPNDTFISAKCQASFRHDAPGADADWSWDWPRFPLFRALYCYYWFYRFLF